MPNRKMPFQIAFVLTVLAFATIASFTIATVGLR